MRTTPVLLLALLLAGCARDGVVQLEAQEDEWVEFLCVPYSPCARITAHSEGGANGYRLALDPKMAGGYGAQAIVDGAPIDLGGYGFGRGQVGPFEGRLPQGSAEEWTFTFSPLSGERGARIMMKITWLHDGPSTEPLCTRVDIATLYSGEELLERTEVLKDSPRETAGCIMERVRPHVTTWNGTRYANLSGELNRDSFGVHGQTWGLTLRGDFGGLPDIWHFTLTIVGGEAQVQGGLSAAGAIPPEEVERAQRIFEATPDAADVRERAPHFIRNLTRWEPEQRIVLFYDATPEGYAGIPERPYARVTIDMQGERIVHVERSLWW